MINFSYIRNDDHYMSDYLICAYYGNGSDWRRRMLIHGEYENYVANASNNSSEVRV